MVEIAKFYAGTLLYPSKTSNINFGVLRISETQNIFTKSQTASSKWFHAEPFGRFWAQELAKPIGEWKSLAE